LVLILAPVKQGSVLLIAWVVSMNTLLVASFAYSLCEVIEEYCPQQAAVEQVFMSKSAGSALKLGQARGAAIVAAVNRDLPVAEYEAKKIKQSVVGNGGADKVQVQHMVKQILKLSGIPQEDAADALAVALCHANSHHHLVSIAQAKQFRRGRMV